jgi:hypothetical protein
MRLSSLQRSTSCQLFREGGSSPTSLAALLGRASSSCLPNSVIQVRKNGNLQQRNLRSDTIILCSHPNRGKCYKFIRRKKASVCIKLNHLRSRYMSSILCLYAFVNNYSNFAAYLEKLEITSCKYYECIYKLIATHQLMVYASDVWLLFTVQKQMPWNKTDMLIKKVLSPYCFCASVGIA